MQHYRGLQTKLVSADALGVVDSIISVAGIVDLGGDMVMLGAFRKTLQTKRVGEVLVLDQHKTDSATDVIARCVSLREVGRSELPSTLLSEHPEATGGLLARSQFFLDVPRSKDIFTSLASGSGASWSIGYTADDYDYTTINGERVRRLKALTLYEYSVVCFAMCNAAMTVSAKCATCTRGGGCRACQDRQVSAMVASERKTWERLYGQELNTIMLSGEGVVLSRVHGYQQKTLNRLAEVRANGRLKVIRECDAALAQIRLIEQCDQELAENNAVRRKLNITLGGSHANCER